MKDYIYSDLALESDYAARTIRSTSKEYSEYSVQDNKICRLDISSDDLAEKYGKKRGVYITVTCGKIWLLSDRELESCARVIGGELKKLLQNATSKTINESFSVLVAGLGNSKITPDAIGPRTVSLLTVTRHIGSVSRKLFRSLGQCTVSAISPGVLAHTGIETLEIISGAVNAAKPDALIAVDALAARSCERLGTTVQISDSGINPGSGIGNLRKAIDRENLNIPVIALGVPTVVDSATLVYDALEKAGIEDIGKNLRQVLDNGRGFFVSPKESDVICDTVALLLSKAIDFALSISDTK